MIRKKILLIGDFNVGKTSLIKRYVCNTFDEKYLSTVGVNISKKRLNNTRESELIIWDIEGQTKIRPIPSSYYNGASGAIFVCDINRSETMESLEKHIENFLKVNPDSKYVVAYNKSDLLNIKEKESFDITNDIFLTSAKEGFNVDILFNTLAERMEL